MFDDATLRKVIGRLMVQVEEERLRRVEIIQALVTLPSSKSFSVKSPTDEEIEQRIEQLSQV